MQINWPEVRPEGLTKVSGQYDEIFRVYVEVFDENDEVFGKSKGQFNGVDQTGPTRVVNNVECWQKCPLKFN